MGFCQHRGAKIIAEFDYVWAEKLKKIKLPQHRFSSIFHKTYVIDKESDLSKENLGHRTFKRVKSVHRYFKKCPLVLFIIQQIVTMPIYGKEALNICHPT